MKATRRHRSVRERTDIVERWQQTGLSAREFAAVEGLKVPSLYLWRKQLRAAGPETAAERKPAFAELRLSTTPPATTQIEIVARNGRIVRVRGEVSARELQQVLAAVEQC